MTWERTLELWNKYERHISAGALVVGFIFDLFLAKRPDSLLDNVLLISYLLIAGALVIFFNTRAARAEAGERPPQSLFLLLVLQFCFGGLASNLLVLYGHSGTLTLSALFILFLAAMLVGNELLKDRYSQLRFNVGVFYVLLFSYLIIAVPTFVLHRADVWAFLFAAASSVLLMVPFLLALSRALRGKQERKLLWEARVIVGGIFLFFIVLYFLNIIPPVPLSVKNIGIYHSIERTPQGDYALTFEPPARFVFWRETAATFTYKSGEDAYCFSSVFAPTALETPILHHWERYNATAKKWETRSRISFPISGGRAAGYRGWSLSTDLTPGEWRCSVETAGGALIGRISFTVIMSSTTPALSQTTL